MMNDSYKNDSVVISSKKMFLDYENRFNETNSELIGDDTNVTVVSELEDYDVKSYLESILGPQRQPSEKVRILTISIFLDFVLHIHLINVDFCQKR